VHGLSLEQGEFYSDFLSLSSAATFALKHAPDDDQGRAFANSFKLNVALLHIDTDDAFCFGRYRPRQQADRGVIGSSARIVQGVSDRPKAAHSGCS
jgi:hypothetical protein